LRFADDIILFAETEGLTNLLEDLNREGKTDCMNKKKTKNMINKVARRRPRQGISIDGEQ
jgi:hypothetical protein